MNKNLSERERQKILARHASYVGRRFSIEEDGVTLRGVIRKHPHERGSYVAEILRKGNRIDTREIDLAGCERNPSFKIDLSND